MILAVDNGFHVTKNSKGIHFYSTIRKGEDVINNNSIQVTVDGESYIIGESNGDYISDADKLKTENNRKNLIMCTLTSIALAYPKSEVINITLAVGTPVSLFAKQKDQLKELMLNLPKQIYVNKTGLNHTINIEDVLVFPQCISTVFRHYKEISDNISMIIDIGGGSVDVSEFDGLRVVGKATFFNGMLVLYEKIAQFINDEYYTNFKSDQIYSLLERGYFTASGERVSMSVISDLIEHHVSELMTKINRSFSINNVDTVFLTGGGAKQLRPYLQSYIANLQIENNAQFSNANGFEYMAKLQLGR